MEYVAQPIYDMNYVSEIMYILFTHRRILTGKDCKEIYHVLIVWMVEL